MAAIRKRCVRFSYAFQRRIRTHIVDASLYGSLMSNQRALRFGRISAPGRTYLLSTSTRQRVPWFARIESARVAARTSSAPEIWRNAVLLAWVVMPDHWHGVIRLVPDGSISDCMLRMKSAVARHVNELNARAGPIWTRGFHDRELRGRDALIGAARYVVMNPIRAGLVDRIEDYPWWGSVWKGAWGDPLMRQ